MGIDDEVPPFLMETKQRRDGRARDNLGTAELIGLFVRPAEVGLTGDWQRKKATAGLHVLLAGCFGLVRA